MRAQMPQQAREVPGCQQALHLLEFPGHAHTLTRNLRAQRWHKRMVFPAAFAAAG
jgi:hypothetical protein